MSIDRDFVGSTRKHAASARVIRCTFCNVDSPALGRASFQMSNAGRNAEYIGSEPAFLLKST